MKTKEDKHISHPLKLYTDGGVISKNPSPYGGTWAWVLVRDDKEIIRKSGYIIQTERYFPSGVVTNNQTELFAIIQGLHVLMDDDVVEICSDSNVSLGRVFRGSSFNNIPTWMMGALSIQQMRLSRWNEFSYTLIGGHPQKASLKKGTNAKGQPVSKWNVLCDQMCHDEADNYWKDKNR